MNLSETTISLSDLQLFGFTDPASGRRAKSKSEASRLARQAIIVIGSDLYLRVFVLFAWAGRLATSAYITKLITVYDQFRPRVFGIEANAMQSLFADCVRDAAREKLKRANFLPVQQSTKVDKDWRIVTTIEPLMADGRLFILDSQTELISEIQGHPTARHKDLADCLASAVSLIPRRPAQARESEEATALAAYLRRTGCPPWRIEQRVAALRSKDRGNGTLRNVRTL